MKIVHVIWSLDPRTGGPGCVIRNVVREQVRRGHQVSLIATDIQVFEPRVAPDEFAQNMANDPDFAGVDLSLGRFFGNGFLGKLGPLASFAYSPECKRLVDERLSNAQTKPDLVHVHGVFAHVVHATAALARRHGIPYVLEPYGSLDPTCMEMGSRRLKRIFTRAIVARDLRDAAFVHPASPLEHESLRRWVSEDRLRTITHGVDVPDFDPTAAAEQFRTRFPQIRDRRVILFMSRYTAKKRPEVIVEAMARLRDEFPDLLLLMAGDDEGQLAIVQEAARRLGLEESVVDAGFIQGDLKHGAFAVADLFVLPSVDENFGIAPIEAMAHGVPALVTPGVGSHVHVDQGQGGRTVEGDPESLAAGIRDILTNDPTEMGRQGRQYVAEHLSWRGVVDQIDDLYRECLSQP